MERAAALVFEFKIEANNVTPVKDDQKVKGDRPFLVHGAKASWIPSDGPLNGQLAPNSSSHPSLAMLAMQGYGEFINFLWKYKLSDNGQDIANKALPSDVLETFFNEDHPIEFPQGLELTFEVTPLANARPGRLFITLMGYYGEM